MKTLVLIRHGHAQQESDDLARQLSHSGARTVRSRARDLAHYLPDQVLCSPSTRTRQTAQALFDELRCDPETKLPKALYLAESAALGELIQATSTAVETLWVIGHNPGLSDLASSLLHEHVALDTADFVILRTPSWLELSNGLCVRV